MDKRRELARRREKKSKGKGKPGKKGFIYRNDRESDMPHHSLSPFLLHHGRRDVEIHSKGEEIEGKHFNTALEYGRSDSSPMRGHCCTKERQSSAVAQTGSAFWNPNGAGRDGGD